MCAVYSTVAACKPKEGLDVALAVTWHKLVRKGVCFNIHWRAVECVITEP